MKKTEKQVEKEILELNNRLKLKTISKKEYLEKQIELMQYALDNLKLSTMKRQYIKNAMHISKTTLNFMQ